MKFVPSLWSASWWERLKALLVLLFLLGGLALAVDRRWWIVMVVWVALIVGAVISWTRDLARAMRHEEKT